MCVISPPPFLILVFCFYKRFCFVWLCCIAAKHSGVVIAWLSPQPHAVIYMWGLINYANYVDKENVTSKLIHGLLVWVSLFIKHMASNLCCLKRLQCIQLSWMYSRSTDKKMYGVFTINIWGHGVPTGGGLSYGRVWRLTLKTSLCSDEQLFRTVSLNYQAKENTPNTALLCQSLLSNPFNFTYQGWSNTL